MHSHDGIGKRATGSRRLVRLLAAPWVLFMAIGCWLGTTPAAAEIVVFVDGGWLKVDTYQLSRKGTRIRLHLPDGGAMVLPILRVARILDDEVVPRPEPPPAPAEVAFEPRWAEAQPIPTVPYGEEIHTAAREAGLNPALVAAVVKAESAFRAHVVSHKGARGLMQLMPATAQRFGVEGDAVFDPVRNLRAGTRYLRWLLDRFDGDVATALAGYNAGEGTIAKYGGVPPYRETRDYIARIFDTLGIAP